MRIKTFEAPTLQDALSRARQELGDEAIVLNTRHVKSSNLLGLRAGTKVEVTAAVDEPAPSDRLQVSGDGCRETEPQAPTTNTQYPTPNAQPPNPNPQAVEILELRSELTRLSAMVQGLIRSGMSVAPCAPLISQLGIDEDLCRGELADLAAIGNADALAAALTAKLTPFAMPPVLDQPRIIALVGPTGVGKTTTLAKLAARFALEQGKKVALVTADTFRIGAVEQLRTYARIMGLPLEIALSPDDVAAGIEKHRDKDIVLVDTVGRSQRSRTHLQELKGFLDAAEGVETHLVVSATLSGDVQREVVEAFSIFSPSRLVITKLDESPNRGALVNLPLRTGLGISYTTAGQNVPQDLDFADAGKLAKMVVDIADRPASHHPEYILSSVEGLVKGWTAGGAASRVEVAA